MVQPDFQ